MNEKKLRAHLIRIYCITVAAVLLVVGDRSWTKNYIDHAQLRELKTENRPLLSLQDNGKRLLYNSTDEPSKRDCFDEVERLAAVDGYDVSMLPLSKERRTSPLHSISSEGVSYLGAVSIFPMETGYRTITMLQSFPITVYEKIPLLLWGYLITITGKKKRKR